LTTTATTPPGLQLQCGIIRRTSSSLSSARSSRTSSLPSAIEIISGLDRQANVVPPIISSLLFLEERKRWLRSNLALKQTRPPTNQGARRAFKVSKSHVVRNSPELSHFATFFFERRTEVSIVISCSFIIQISGSVTGRVSTNRNDKGCSLAYNTSFQFKSFTKDSSNGQIRNCHSA
jgi:hypothetical protein